jgi:hypothetical protein
MRLLQWFGGGLLGALVVALWVVQCSGPRPDVVGSPTVRPPDESGQPYVVEVNVRNSGPGHGQVQVIARIRDRATGRTYQKTEQAQLEAGEETRLAIDIDAPEGEYEPRIEVEYPPG